MAVGVPGRGGVERVLLLNNLTPSPSFKIEYILIVANNDIPKKKRKKENIYIWLLCRNTGLNSVLFSFFFLFFSFFFLRIKRLISQSYTWRWLLSV